MLGLALPQKPSSSPLLLFTYPFFLTARFYSLLRPMLRYQSHHSISKTIRSAKVKIAAADAKCSCQHRVRTHTLARFARHFLTSCTRVLGIESPMRFFFGCFRYYTSIGKCSGRHTLSLHLRARFSFKKRKKKEKKRKRGLPTTLKSFS